MIDVLQEFIDPNNNLNLPYDAYIGLMLQGLQNSKYYQNNIVNSTESRIYNGVTYNLVNYYNTTAASAILDLNCN